jgi:hypothetical protein
MNDVKFWIGAAVTGVLSLTSLILLFTMWESSSWIPGLFGVLAGISAAIFYGIGWTGRGNWQGK